MGFSSLLLVIRKKVLLHNLIVQVQRVYQNEKLKESDDFIYELKLSKVLRNKGFKKMEKRNL